jgi:GNAT superfamily N-acetyltransferase
VTPCSIRRAGAADAEALAAFGERTFRETYGAVNTPANTDNYVRGAYGSATQMAELGDPKITTLVAVDPEGALAGFAQLRMDRPVPSRGAAPATELWRFYVDRPWHGQGLAGQLMSAVRQETRAQGHDTLWLAVWEHNPRAITFYTREGFRSIGQQSFQLGDDLQTDQVMLATLDQGEG